MDVPDVGQVPVQGGSNQPTSGTYGEGAANDRLKQALPPTPTPQGPQAPAVTMPPVGQPPVGGPAPMGRPPGGQTPPGIPNAILEGGPPQAQAGPGLPTPAVATPAQGRLLVLQQLASSGDVSDETRQWAQMVLKVLIG